MPRCTTTSSAVVGSSARTTLGDIKVASAMITRWRMPPESWNGYASSTSGERLSSSRYFATRASVCFSVSFRLSCFGMESRNCFLSRTMGFSTLCAACGT